MEEIIQEDKHLLVYLNGLGSQTFDGFWITVSTVAIWIPFYIILAYLLYKNYRLSSFVFILIFIALGLTVSDQLANIFKHGIERFRPCHDPAIKAVIRKVKCGGRFGFYSGHASNTFFIASFLSFVLGRKIRILPYVLFFWAALVSYSRIYLGVHFPMDILMGAMMGFLLGGFFSTLARNVIAKQNRNSQNQSL